MHYLKKYRINEMPMYREACIDALQFMGATRYKLLARLIAYGEANDNQIRLLASIAGVEGFPITAMIERYSNE